MHSSNVSHNRSVLLELEALEPRDVPSTADFVTGLYATILHRLPSAAEVQPYVASINSGASPVDIALGFTNSLERHIDLVQENYQGFLQRSPSSNELNFWVAQLQGGLGEEQMEAGFLSSPEFFNLHGNAAGPWVGAVYHDVLGRAVEPAGLAFWTSALNSGASLQSVAIDIVASPESFTRMVTRAYHDLLGRSPDPGGLAGWVTNLEQGLPPSSLVAQIASSTEFIDRYGGLDVLPNSVDTFVQPVLVPAVGVIGFGGTTPGLIGGFTGGLTGGFTGGFTGGSGCSC